MPISTKSSKAKTSKTCKEMPSYYDEFKKKCMDDVKNLKLNKHSFERDYINKYKFKTKNSNDIKYSLLLNAEKVINRKKGVDSIIEYVKDYKIATEIESGVFEYSLIYVTVNNLNNHFIENIYNEKIYDLCVNLDVKNKNIGNETLIHTVLSSDFDPYFLAFFSPEQLHPKKWASVVAKKDIREMAANTFQTTDIYKCAKCGERKFKITEFQLRCADEPSNKFCTCMVCYHTFIL